MLADEINRAPPKTQAALLETMQERQVSVGAVTHALPRPLFVLATRNPIEQEGTYPLPEAQRDRFLFEVAVDYPERDDEYAIVRVTTSAAERAVEPVLNAEELIKFQSLVRRTPVPEHVLRAAVDVARQSRPIDPTAPDFVRQYVAWGAGPRAGQALVLAAKARAVLHGRPAAEASDVQFAAAAAFRPRLVLNYHAEADGVTPEALAERLIAASDVLRSTP